MNAHPTPCFWTTEGSNTVIVLGVTNRPAEVDPAILRRLSRQFEIGLPTTVDARREILSILTSGFNLHANVCLESVARHTERYVGGVVAWRMPMYILSFSELVVYSVAHAVYTHSINSSMKHITRSNECQNNADSFRTLVPMILWPSENSDYHLI